MNLDSVSFHKHAKIELSQYPAIVTSHLVKNPYLGDPNNILQLTARSKRQSLVFFNNSKYVKISGKSTKKYISFSFFSTRLKFHILCFENFEKNIRSERWPPSGLREALSNLMSPLEAATSMQRNACRIILFSAKHIGRYCA